MSNARDMIKKETIMGYLNLGLSVIPVGKDKKALIPWSEYQKRRAEEKEVDNWLKTFHPLEALAMVTGSVSKICVVDIDFPFSGSIVTNTTDSIKDNNNNNNIILLLNAKSLNAKKIVSVTPRGGRHWWFKAPENCPANRAAFLEKVDFRGEGGYVLIPPSVAWNSDSLKGGTTVDGRYKFELEGRNLSDWLSEIDTLPPEIEKLLSTSDYRVSTPGYRCLQLSTTLFAEGRRDNDLFRVSAALVDGHCNNDLARETVYRLAMSCGFDKNEAQEKVNSALKRDAIKKQTISEAVREWVLSSNGNFLSTDVYNCLQLSTREEKKNVSIILRRMVDDKELLKDRTQNGKWRRIDKDIKPIDYKNANTEPFDVVLPFGIEKLAHIYPKNVVVIAGEPNSGKSAFLLNFAQMNQDKHPVYYFSSEMGDSELKLRLSKFDAPLDNWKTNFFEKSEGFADVIVPDAINIVDYLEIHQEHFLIGQWIKDIFDKLTTGIAVIAIQKKPNQNIGVGGIATLEKPRLYLSMSPGKIIIEKAKSFANINLNPNHAEMAFSLRGGAKFTQLGDWMKDGSKLLVPATLDWATE